MAERCEVCGCKWEVYSPSYSHSPGSVSHYCRGRLVGKVADTPELRAMCDASAATSRANAGVIRND